MRHVDEGTLHAWIEGELGDPVEAARIDDHVRHCDRCRETADVARATIVDAEQLLARTLPAARQPAFTELAAHVAAGSTAWSEPRRRSRTWMTAAAWAATVVVAAGIGWIARDLRTPGNDQKSAATGVVAVKATDIFAQAPREPNGEVPPATLRSDNDTRASSEPKPSTQSAVPTDTDGLAPWALKQLRDAGSAEDQTARSTPIPGASMSLPPVPPDFLANRSTIEPPDFLVNRSTIQEAPAVDARKQEGVSYPPGGSLAQTFSGAASVPVMNGTGQAMPGRIIVDGMATAELALARRYPAARPFAKTSVEWRALPRTAAAVQSGMALRGINGMTPSSTMLNADNTVVRTLYQIAPGQTLEIWQGVGVSALSNAPADQPPAAVFTWQDGWSVMVDGVQLLLRGAAGPERLPEFAKRLRVD